MNSPDISSPSTPVADATPLSDAQLELMCRAHDAEDAAQCGEPSPWEKTLFDPITGIEYTDFRGDRIAAMRCAVEALSGAALETHDGQLRAEQQTRSELLRANLLNSVLVETGEPIAKVADLFGEQWPDGHGVHVRLGDLRKFREALSQAHSVKGEGFK